MTSSVVLCQMIRKSVETRDWIATIEPRSVRAVMKRVVEDLTLVDLQVGMLYEEGVRKDRSSGKQTKPTQQLSFVKGFFPCLVDDSRRTYSQSRQMGKPWGYTPRLALFVKVHFYGRVACFDLCSVALDIYISSSVLL